MYDTITNKTKFAFCENWINLFNFKSIICMKNERVQLFLQPTLFQEFVSYVSTEVSKKYYIMFNSTQVV